MTLAGLDPGVFRDECALIAAGIGALAMEIVKPRGRCSRTGWIILAGVLLALLTDAIRPAPDAVMSKGAYLVDPLSRYFKGILLLALALVVLPSLRHEDDGPRNGESLAFLAFSTAGMMLMAGSGDFVLLFVSYEFALTGFCLAALLVPGDGGFGSGGEGLKLLVAGAFSSAFLACGTAFLYAGCGSTLLADIGVAAAARSREPQMICGLTFVIAGLGFAIAAVPFHMWVPDADAGQKASTPVAVFAFVSLKAAGFSVMVRVLTGALSSLQGIWTWQLSVLAGLTIAVGGFAEIMQKDMKRLVAFSSIAQGGYVLAGLAAGGERGTSSAVFHLTTYAFAMLGAAISVGVFQRHSGTVGMASFAGLGRRSPLLAFTLTLSLLSLAGVPPLGGFASKVCVFEAAMEISPGMPWLSVCGVVLSVVSLYYYMLVIRRLYFETPLDSGRVPVGRGLSAALLCCVAGMLLTGLRAKDVLDMTLAVARTALGR